MKLQSKINIRFLLVTLLLFAVAGVVFYFVLNQVIDQNIREMLRSRMTNVNLYLQQTKGDHFVLESPDRSILIRKITKSESYTNFSDTLVFDEDEKQLIPFRKLVFSTVANGDHFEVTILQSLLESEDLQATIFYFMIFLFFISLLSLFFLNRWLSEKAWTPFFQSLTKLKSWKIGENQQVSFDRTDISEFDQLNQLLAGMIQKMQTDFINLKEFAENASHEIQTPLAIVKSKLELVLNDKDLSDLQHKRLHDAFESLIRLSKLNDALLLLSKIENRQFAEKSEINMSGLIQARLEYLEELFALKGIQMSVQLAIPVTIPIHPMLAEILINNLLSNALKHSPEHGKVVISSGNGEIIFCNSGDPLPFDPSKLFQRFTKHRTSADSTGLGLAIATEICRANHLRLSYAYSNPLHCFALKIE